MTDDVEILEPENIDKYIYSKLVKIGYIKKRVATIIVNGVAQQEQEVQVLAIVCPDCNNILFEFQQDVSMIDLNKEMLSNIEMFSNAPTHCPHCGQKLSYNRSLV